MDSWSRVRDVEKVKPFADRAEKLYVEIGVYRHALQTVHGDTKLVHTLLSTQALLREAIDRGVKGED